MFELASKAGAATRMTFTEQVAFLDGQGDLDEHRLGTEVGVQRLVLRFADAWHF